MFAIDSGYAYLVDGDTGYKVSFDVFGQVNISSGDTISITNQELYTYDEMVKKVNYANQVDTLRKSRIFANTNEEIFDNFFDKLKRKFNNKEFDKIVYDTIIDISNYEDDVVISFDKNGGTGTMPQIRKEVGDTYTLPPCEFVAPATKRFKEWKIGDTSYDVGDEVTVEENITVKAIWEVIPTYTISFDANGGSGTMDSATVNDGESYTLPASTFTAPEDKEFDQWLIGEDSYDVGEDYTPSDDTTVKATWKSIEVEE